MAILSFDKWRLCRSVALFGLGGLSLSAYPTAAQADEPRQPTEPPVLSDTAVELLDVADAFDDNDFFDLNLRLSFDHEQRTAAIQRESAALSNGGYTSEEMDVATYQESTQRLIPEINIGILPELAISVRMPIILANNRRLDDRNGSSGQLPPVEGLEGESLFTVPFESPTRSGIEYLAVGMDLGLMSQFRNPAHPNWVIGIEGRFNVSEPMRACSANPAPGEVSCAYAEDINRNGENDVLGPAFDAPLNGGGNLATENEGNFSGSRQPGVSRGTHAIQGHAYVSRRLKYIEPYTGIEALAEFQLPDSEYGSVKLEGVLVDHPPLRGTVLAGVAVIPWEQPEKFQRIAFDFRFSGTYVSEGRDYSELFDALGSSNAYSLRTPNYEGYGPNIVPGGIDPYVPSVVDPNSGRVSFTGVTDVQQHGDYKLRAQFTWQAGKYIKFDLGSAWRVIQGHFITFDQGCNPDFVGEVVLSGPCKVQVGETTNSNGAVVPEWQSAGLPNPDQRKVINDPGRRYKVGTSHGLQAWFRASVLF